MPLPLYPPPQANNPNTHVTGEKRGFTEDVYVQRPSRWLIYIWKGSEGNSHGSL
jgi:hypothetical protein